jgi:hypothetical protein
MKIAPRLHGNPDPACVGNNQQSAISNQQPSTINHHGQRQPKSAAGNPQTQEGKTQSAHPSPARRLKIPTAEAGGITPPAFPRQI